MTGFLNLRDMIDGGGPGRSGDTFQGGLLSGFLNDLGIKPRGYWERQGLLGQQPMPTPMPAPMPQPVQPQGIETTTLPMIAGMTPEQIRALIDYASRDPRYVGPQ